MNFSWLESLIYGLISGLAEFLPISAEGHQHIMLYLFGGEIRDPVRDFFVHIGLLLCVVTCSRTLLDMIKRERSYSARVRATYQYPSRVRQDADFVRACTLPLILCTILFKFIFKTGSSLIVTALFILINGVIIFLPDRMMQGNKDASIMSPVDSILIGGAGALSVLTGISRFGFTYSASVARGAGKSHAFVWSLLLSIPAIACNCFFDVFSMFSGVPFSFWSNILGYILSGVAAFAGGYLSISATRSITSRSGFAPFAYYCLGLALLAFFIFLTVA